MTVWDYVASHTFDNPDHQIDLLLNRAKRRFKKKKLRILDAGGGLANRGEMITRLGKRTVFDIVPGPNVDVVGDLHHLPFPDASFDVITLFMVMEHLYDPARAIRECERVLKHNGVLVATTVQYWHNHAHPHDYFRYTKTGLEYIFSSAGLPIREIWSLGGPFLVLFHVIELNLPSYLRRFFLYTCGIFNYFDKVVFHHQDQRPNSDSVGWSLLAQKN